MRPIILAAAFVFMLIGPALPWGSEGHQLVGSVADQMLTKRAKQEVRKNLGFTLQVAAPWPDCVRSVVKRPDGSFKYAPSKPEYRIPCRSFETSKEKARMEDYARRNWNACVYQDGRAGCQDSYHFADVAIQHNDYQRTYAGTSDHDIVSVINAAIAVLKGQPAPPPFSIRDKKEALFLVAHFLGDLHQPLHVGAVYLAPDGKLVNPDQGGPVDAATETHGGNSIFETVNSKCEGRNLHSDWDDVPDSFGTRANKAMLKTAKATPKTPGPLESFAAAWAGDTVRASQSAFKGLTFVGACKGHWLAKFEDRRTYLKNQTALQRKQVAKGGARLAEVLNIVWP